MPRQFTLPAALDASRLAAVIGLLLTLLVVGGWLVGVLNGSAIGGQVAAAAAAILISAAALLYAFRLGTSPASE